MLGTQLTRALLGALAALPAVHCVAFGGPAPTDILPSRANKGWTPVPTKGPSIVELRKRQSSGPETCGFVDGEYCTSTHPAIARDVRKETDSPCVQHEP